MPLRPFERPDPIYTTLTFFLLGLGVVAVYSASFFYASASGKGEFYYLKGHLIRLIPGIILFFLVQRVPYHSLRSLSGPGYFTLLFLLVITFILGPRIYGARRWLPVSGFSVQVSEMSKLWIVIYLASVLSFKMELFSELRRMILPMAMIGSIILLVLIQPNFSMAAVMAGVTLYLIILAGVRMRYVLLIVGLVLLSLFLLIYRFPHTSSRIHHFLSG
ncbi:MAG TPA: hypothetical protein EYP24_05905, partial [bacterium (Candidatus Stahlbacteria)]|nr:hypothetical protein [Candidatus Stahlbacteria bacterium]